MTSVFTGLQKYIVFAFSVKSNYCVEEELMVWCVPHTDLRMEFISWRLLSSSFAKQ